jgi:hypothetical protein
MHKVHFYVYGLCATYKTALGVDNWILRTLYIHTVRDYR